MDDKDRIKSLEEELLSTKLELQDKIMPPSLV